MIKIYKNFDKKDKHISPTYGECVITKIASFDYILAVEKGKLKEVYLTYQKLKELLGSVIIKNKVPIEINGRTLYKFDVWVAVFEDNKDKPAHVISLNKKRIENILKKIDERTI